jgi:hypothetical protein
VALLARISQARRGRATAFFSLLSEYSKENICRDMKSVISSRTRISDCQRSIVLLINKNPRPITIYLAEWFTVVKRSA